jgi:hypothetical protein
MSAVLKLLSKAAFTWRRETVVGQILRLPLRAVPKTATFPILSGPARGIKWSTGAGVADFWMGTYETEKAELLVRHVKPGGTAYDVGANVGFYSLLVSRLVGPTGALLHLNPRREILASYAII